MFHLVVQARPKTVESGYVDQDDSAWAQFFPELHYGRRVVADVFEHIEGKDKRCGIVGQRINSRQGLESVVDQLLPLAFVRLDAENVVAFALQAPGKSSHSAAEIDEAFFPPRSSADKVGQEGVVVVGAFERCEDVAAGVFAFHAAFLLEKRLYLIIA